MTQWELLGESGVRSAFTLLRDHLKSDYKLWKGSHTDELIFRGACICSFREKQQGGLESSQTGSSGNQPCYWTQQRLILRILPLGPDTKSGNLLGSYGGINHTELKAPLRYTNSYWYYWTQINLHWRGERLSSGLCHISYHPKHSCSAGLRPALIVSYLLWTCGPQYSPSRKTCWDKWPNVDGEAFSP